MTPKIPVTVLAGAMGAGKTTLINRIVARAASASSSSRTRSAR